VDARLLVGGTRVPVLVGEGGNFDKRLRTGYNGIDG
jgi:hypothetical protein